MVKGVSRQVIVMHSPDPELFDQAIFILKDSAVSKGVTEDTLMKEAKRLLNTGRYENRGKASVVEPFWISVGAMQRLPLPEWEPKGRYKRPKDLE